MVNLRLTVRLNSTPPGAPACVRETWFGTPVNVEEAPHDDPNGATATPRQSGTLRTMRARGFNGRNRCRTQTESIGVLGRAAHGDERTGFNHMTTRLPLLAASGIHALAVLRTSAPARCRRSA